MARKPKNNDKNPARDACQTPSYALDLLIPYLKRDDIVWESAAGEGLLSDALGRYVKRVIGTDLLTGQNYFDNLHVPYHYTVQITNPPFSLKYRWLERAYQMGKPFALLMPADTLFAATAQALFDAYGFGMLLPNQRIDFKMPNTGWKGSAQFTSAWFTWKLGVRDCVNRVKVNWTEQKRLMKQGEIAPIQPVITPLCLQQLPMFQEDANRRFDDAPTLSP